jgi:hypothetical protein
MKRFLLLGFLLLSACQASPATHSLPAASPTRKPPSTVPPSSTATLIPPPTVTGTPPPRFFTEDFDAPPAYWSTLFASGPAQNADILNRDGRLVFALYNPNTWAYAIFGAHVYESVNIQANFVNQGSDSNYAGVLCLYDEQAGWIEFNLSNDGSFSLLFGQWLAEDIARYTPILYETSAYILTESAVNEMGLDCFDDTVQLYINGKLIRKLDISRFELSRGKVGLAAASFETTPVIVGFDWVKVSQP